MIGKRELAQDLTMIVATAVITATVATNNHTCDKCDEMKDEYMRRTAIMRDKLIERQERNDYLNKLIEPCTAEECERCWLERQF